MAANKHHFDAWGQPIVDLYGMFSYYLKDKDSTEVLRKRLPYRYVALPTVHISFWKVDPRHVTVTRIYPGGSVSKDYYLSERAVCALRKAYVGKKRGWRGSLECGRVSLKREGFLFCPVVTRYYSQAV